MAEQIKTVFGSSKVSSSTLPPTRRILTTNDLTEKGIRYHINHLRRSGRQAGNFPHHSIRRHVGVLGMRTKSTDGWKANMPSNKQRSMLGTRRLKRSDSTYRTTSAGAMGQSRPSQSEPDAVNI